MRTTSLSKVGNAIYWQTIQYGGEKVIFILRLLILAKLLTPDDFGLLAISSVAIDFLTRISNFGMIPALIQREDATEDLFDAAWTIGVLRALAITTIIFFTAPVLANFFAEPRSTDILRALSFRPLIDAMASIIVTRFTRNLDFRSLVFMQLPKAFTNMVVSIALAKWLGVWALVAGTLAGPGIYLVLSYIFAPHTPRFVFKPGSIRALINFGRWVFWTSIIVMLGQTTLRVVVSRQLGAAELGLYYLAASLAFLPTDIASQIVGEVTFPFYSRLQKDIARVTDAFRSILTSLAVLLLPMTGLMISLAPSLVENVLDERWMGTVRIIQVLAIANIIDMLGETISPILKGIGHPEKVMIMESLQSFTLILSVWGFTKAYGIVGAALAWIPSVVVSQLLGLFFLRQLLDNPLFNLHKPILTIGMVSILGSIGAYSISSLIPGLVGFIIAVLISLLFMGSLLIYLERKFLLGLSNGFTKAFPGLSAYLKLEDQNLA